MNSKVTRVHNKLRNSLNRNGYLNINHIQIEGRKKLTEIAYLFKNPEYQTFRILYMKDSHIIGEEIITIKLIHSNRVSQVCIAGLVRAERCINKIKNKMKLIQANQYLLIHTTPLEKIQISKQDIDTTSFFYTYLDGFIGHVIINSKSYLWIDVYKNKIYITNKKLANKNKCIHKKISNISIKTRKDIIRIVSNLLTNNNHSIIAITKLGEMPDMLIDIPNQCINQNIQSYLDSLRNSYKDSNIILVTDNANVFKQSMELLIDSIIDDSVWYTELKGNLYMYNLPNLNKYQEYKNTIRRDTIWKKKKSF